MHTDGTDTFVKDNKGRVWSWGANSLGSLGNGTNTQIMQPYCINTGVLENKTIKQLYHNYRSTIVLTEDGNMYATGDCKATTGLSTATTTFTLINSNITGIEKFDVIVNNDPNKNVVIAYSTNAVWGWGYNQYGTLAVTTASPYIQTPIRIFSNSIKEFHIKPKKSSAAEASTAIIDADNKLWTWGEYPKGHALGGITMKCITDMVGSPLQGIEMDTFLNVESDPLSAVLKDVDGNIWIISNVYSNSLTIPVRAKDSKLGEMAQTVYGEITEQNIENIINGMNAGILEANGKIWTFKQASSYNTGLRVEENTQLNELKETKNITQYINNKAIDEDGNLYVWGKNTAVQPGAAITCLTTTPVAADATIGNGWTTVTRQY